MTRRLITAVALCLATAAQAETLRFTDLDKQLHVGGSTLIGVTARQVMDTPGQAVAACVAVGAAKEVVWQVAGYTRFSHADMAANTVGCVIGAYLGSGLQVRASRTDGISISFRWSF